MCLAQIFSKFLQSALSVVERLNLIARGILTETGHIVNILGQGVQEFHKQFDGLNAGSLMFTDNIDHISNVQLLGVPIIVPYEIKQVLPCYFEQSPISLIALEKCNGFEYFAALPPSFSILVRTLSKLEHKC